MCRSGWVRVDSGNTADLAYQNKVTITAALLLAVQGYVALFSRHFENRRSERLIQVKRLETRIIVLSSHTKAECRGKSDAALLQLQQGNMRVPTPRIQRRASFHGLRGP